MSGREVLNGVPYSIRVDFDAAPAVQESDAVGALAVHPSESRDGYYKDIFMDSGIKLTARKFLPSARHLEAEYEVFSRTDNTLRDTVMQHRCFVGTEMDSNGILLYPDGAARYKVVYVNGGLATRHGSSLGPDGRERFRQYVNGGGSFVGTCAGGFIGTTGIINVDNSFEVNQEYLHLWPGRTRDTYLAGKRFKMYMEPNSPLLKYYNYVTKNCCKFIGVFELYNQFMNSNGHLESHYKRIMDKINIVKLNIKQNKSSIRKHGEDILAKYRNNPTGSLAEFVKKCESSAKLEEHGISNGKI